MELTPKIVNDNESFEAFRLILQSSNLPYSDLNFKDHLLVGYYDETGLIGTGGLEIYGQHALLRSLAVKIGVRGLSLGSFITKDLINQARKKSLKAIYLLTETAHGFFALKGFKDISRDEAPNAVRLSSEFSRVCPASAACMVLELVDNQSLEVINQ